MQACDAFCARSKDEPGICFYWREGPGISTPYCAHPRGIKCVFEGRRVYFRGDSDDDGYPD